MPHHLRLLKKKLSVFYFKTTVEKSEIIVTIPYVLHLLNRRVKTFVQCEIRDQKKIK